MTNWQRFLVIIQLCFAFSLILWYATQPFMGEYFSLRSRMLLYEFVIGKSDFLKNQKQMEAQLQRNAKRFEQLDLVQRQKIEAGYSKLQTYAQRPAFKKIGEGTEVLFLRIPPFQIAWLVFASVIGVLLLLNRPGAKQVAWLLPLITLVYAFDNQSNGRVATQDPDYHLFPSEQLLVQNYLPKTDSKNKITQKQLKTSWDNFLISNWSLKTPTTDINALENAEFNFTSARLLLLYQQPPNHWLNDLQDKSSPWLLGIYLIWNIYFAWALNKTKARCHLMAV